MKGLFVSGLLAVALVVGFGATRPALAMDTDYENQCMIQFDPDGWVGQTREFYCDQESQMSGWHWEDAEEEIADMMYRYCTDRHPGSYGATILFYSFNESPSHSSDGAMGTFRCTGIWD
jgi:hypothetical protein